MTNPRLRARTLCTCLATTLFAALAPAQETLIYRTPAGVEFRVSARGLESVRAANRDLATGHWAVFPAEPWFKEYKDLKGTVAIPKEKDLRRQFTPIDPRRARVTHTGGDLTCIYDYQFDGEDLTISARIENARPDVPLNLSGFTGLDFTFDTPPDGLMPVQHFSYFQAHGVGLCHPSHWMKIGGTWAADSSIGVGTSPANTGLARTLTLWDYDWSPTAREKSPKRRLIYIAASPVPPRGAATFDFKIRVSPTRDWKHLLEPYRDHFRKTFGPVQYKADYRWIATDYLNHSQKAISPTNPYGFHGGHRRIDTPEGAAKFCETVIAPLKENAGQGVIVWGQAGDDPRGGMYRPDFDILPPEVAAQLPTIINRFKNAGLKFGVTTRPRDMAVKLDWRRDQIISINPDDPGHRAMLLRRFENMTQKGCTLFYLDSFGDSFEDVKLMRFLRQNLGPDVLTFAEHQCDAIMPYSGGYSETSFYPAEADKPARYRLWSGTDAWQIYEWLTPGTQMAARLYETKGKLPATPEGGPDEWFLQHRITTLLPTGDVKRAPLIKQLWPRYANDQGAWR